MQNLGLNTLISGKFRGKIEILSTHNLLCRRLAAACWETATFCPACFVLPTTIRMMMIVCVLIAGVSGQQSKTPTSTTTQAASTSSVSTPSHAVKPTTATPATTAAASSSAAAATTTEPHESAVKRLEKLDPAEVTSNYSTNARLCGVTVRSGLHCPATFSHRCRYPFPPLFSVLCNVTHCYSLSSRCFPNSDTLALLRSSPAPSIHLFDGLPYFYHVHLAATDKLFS